MHQILLVFFFEKALNIFRREKQVDYIVYESYIDTIGLEYNFLENLLSKVHGGNFVIWQPKNSFHLTNKNNSILCMSSFSKDQGFKVWEIF